MNAEQETKVAANASCIMNAETFLRENHPKDGSEPNEAWNTVCYLLKYTKWLKEQYDTALREKQERENPEPQSGVKGIWIEEDDDEIEITVHRRDKPVRICVGTGDVVIVEKLYGPAVLEDLRIECTYHGWKVSGDDVILESGELALEALREKAEREGCVWCKEDNKVFHDGQHFHFFCSYCGKRLEVNNG